MFYNSLYQSMLHAAELAIEITIFVLVMTVVALYGQTSEVPATPIGWQGSLLAAPAAKPLAELPKMFQQPTEKKPALQMQAWIKPDDVPRLFAVTPKPTLKPRAPSPAPRVASSSGAAPSLAPRAASPASNAVPRAAPVFQQQPQQRVRGRLFQRWGR